MFGRFFIFTIISQTKINIFLNYRPRFDIYKKISSIVKRGCKFESPPMSPTKIQERLKGFQKVCDISKTINSDIDIPTPLSPKRVESPITPELGRGKRPKIQTPKGKAFFGSSTSHGKSKFQKRCNFKIHSDPVQAVIDSMSFCM